MPTNREKNKLPFDIRKMYCQSVDIHQQITYYETNIISEKEFIDEVRNVVNKYKKADEKSGLIP